MRAKTKRFFVNVCSVILMFTLLLGIGFTKLVQAKAEETFSGTVVTAETMASNKDKLLPAFNHQGVERLSVSETAISPWENGFFYYNEEVEGVDLNLTFTAGADICFALRTDGDGTLWQAKGYYAFVNGTVVEIYKVTDLANWNNNQLVKGTFNNLFDGAEHNVKFSAFTGSEGNVQISFSIDGAEALTAIDSDPIAMTGSEFKIARVNTLAVYTVGIPEKESTETFEGTLVTGEDMAKNPDKLLPVFNHSGAERLTVTDTAIYPWENGFYYYNAEVEGVDLNLTFTEGTDICMALRTDGNGAMWAANGYYAFINNATVEIYKVTSDLTVWNENRLLQGTFNNIFDGEEHNVKFSAFTGSEGNVRLSFSIDGAEAITIVDSNPIAMTGTEFKMARVNTNAVYTVNLPKAETSEEFSGTLITGEDMAKNPDKLLPAFNHQGAERLTVTDTAISPWENGFYYYNAEVEGVDLNITFTAGTDICMALRSNGDGCMWGSNGYYAFINNGVVEIYKVTNPSTWNDILLAKGNFNSIFDGEEHNVKFSAFNGDKGSVQLSLSIDGAEAITAIDSEPIAMEGTEFKMARVNSASVYTVNLEQEEAETFSGTTVTAKDMYDNADKLLPAFNHSGAERLSVADNKITPWEDGHFFYGAEVEGVDVNISFTEGTNICFALRTNGGGAMWTSTGYYAYINATTVEIYKVTNPGTWNDTQLVKGTFNNIFDGKVHNVKFTAFNGSNGSVQISFSIDGADAITAIDNENPIAITGTEFKIARVNAASVYTVHTELSQTPDVPDVPDEPDDTVYDDVFNKVTVDDMISDGVKDGYPNGNALDVSNDVITSSARGKLVYEAEVEAVELDFKSVSSSSVFFVLRASGDAAIWDNGKGYFFMVDKSTTGTNIRLFKSVNGDGTFEELASATSDILLYDGERHVIYFGANDVAANNTKLLFRIDGKEIINYTDTSDIVRLKDSHLLICSGTSEGMYKLFGENGFEIDLGSAEYKVITSKTMLSSSSYWTLDGSILNGKESISATGDQTKTLFTKITKNCMYNFDIDLDDLQGNWVAIMLNANKADAIWNSGFRSNVIFLRKGSIAIDYWNPQTPIATVSTSIDMEARMNVECGIYELTANGKTYYCLRIAINDEELYNAILPEGSYVEDGYFGLMNYGTAKYTLYATENEMDKFDSATDGSAVAKEDESAKTNVIDAKDFAPINSIWNVSYMPDGEGMRVGNQGDVTYKNSVNFSQFSFELKFNEAEITGQFAQFLFGKKRQDSFLNQRLAYDSTNYGYGVRIFPTGLISIIKTDTGDGVKTLMTYDYGQDNNATLLDGQYHTFTVYRKLVDNQMYIAIFVDGLEVGYATVDNDYYAPNYPMDGFIAFSNSKDDSYFWVQNIKYAGTETEVGKDLKADAVNLATVMEDELGKYLFVAFDSASYTTKWVEVYAVTAAGEKGELLGCIYAPKSILDLGDYTGKQILVVSVGFDESGNKYEYVDCNKEYETLNPANVSAITIKQSENGAYFIYKDTGEEYLPVGGNWMGLRGGDHSTFDAATAFTKADYDPNRAEAMLRALSENGGNVVRVFLIGRTSMNPGISGDSTIGVDDSNYYYEGLYLPYMENFVHFLRTAQKYGVYVMAALGDCDVPQNSYYMQLQGGANLARNALYMTPAGVLARTTYAANVAKYLKNFAPDAISGLLSIELQNEFAIYGDQWPFNLTEGTVTLANGNTYDMANVDSRELAFKESVIYYLNEMTAAIKAQLPELLVNEGTFTRNIVGNNHVYGMTGMNSGDVRLPATIDTYLSSNIDFLDLHIYHAGGLSNSILNSFADDLTYMNFYEEATQELLKSKPIFMGEFGPAYHLAANFEGAYEAWVETVRLAADAGFKGFAVWTLDSHNQTSHWSVLANDGKWDAFREMVRVQLGVENVESFTVADKTLLLGEALSVDISEYLVEGDKVSYSVDGGEFGELPIFTSAGTYTVTVRVEREYAASYETSFTVTVNEEASTPDQPTAPDSSSSDAASDASCFALVSSSAFGLTILLAGMAIIVMKKRKYSK